MKLVGGRLGPPSGRRVLTEDLAFTDAVASQHQPQQACDQEEGPGAAVGSILSLDGAAADDHAMKLRLWV